LTACAAQQAPAAAPPRAVPRDCQLFIDHFRPVASQLLEVRVFAAGEASLPLLRPSRDGALVDAIAAFLERPAPPAPRTAPAMLDNMRQVVRDQTVDMRGLLGALTRGDLESYRRLSIRYRSGREQLRSLDDSLDATCGAHLLARGRLPFSQIVATFQEREPAFRKCYEDGRARNRQLADRLDVKFSIDEHGAVVRAEVDPDARAPVLDRGTEPFFAQLGYPVEVQEQARRPTLTDQGVIACVLGEVKTMRFDPVRGGATVRFPIMQNGQPPVAPSDD
jgi:hypothetical protein